MNRSEATSIYKRLCKYYNNKDYIDDLGMQDIYYNNLKYITKENWDIIEPKLFDECKFFPKIADINKIKYALPKEKKIFDTVPCPYCHGTGMLNVTEIIDGMPYEFAARCKCQNGEQHKYDGRTLKDEKRRSPYYIPEISEKIPNFYEDFDRQNTPNNEAVDINKIKQNMNNVAKKMSI